MVLFVYSVSVLFIWNIGMSGTNMDYALFEEKYLRAKEENA